MLSHEVKGGYKVQVEWYLKAEMYLREILELAEKHASKMLQNAVFSPELIELLINLFPHGYKIKLLKARNDDCEVYMRNILAKIVEFRVSALELQNTEFSVDTNRKEKTYFIVLLSAGNIIHQKGKDILKRMECTISNLKF